MDIGFVKSGSTDSGIAIICTTEDGIKGASISALDTATSGALSKAFSVADFTGKKGKSVNLLAPVGIDADRVIVQGVGDVTKMSEYDYVALGASIYTAVAKAGSDEATVSFDGLSAENAAFMAEGVQLKSYRFDKYRTKEAKSKKPTLKSLNIACDDLSGAATCFAVRSAVADGVNMTRDLVSEPANVLYPQTFADEIQTLTDLGVEVEILGEAEMEKLGMGSLLAVGQGSIRESKLGIMRWNGGANADEQPIAFIGKGVTFDTGGISLKPAPGMEQMKWDMGGAGTVTGLMKALAGRKANVNVVAIVGLVENMPSGNAIRPGDVVTSMSGQTIEILNTDAEGRLVLADALWYCQDRFKPKFMIDLATLTGAIIVSLANEYAGMFTDSDDLSNTLSAAGTVTGDKVWRLPLHDNYDKMINCATADMKNIGGKGAGSITAAQFLKRFTNDVPWCHLDIAGTVWSDKDMSLSEKGGTGFGVRMLDRFVADNHEG